MSERKYEMRRVLAPKDARPRCSNCDSVLLFDKPWCRKGGRHIGDAHRLCSELRALKELNGKLHTALSDAQRALLAEGKVRP